MPTGSASTHFVAARPYHSVGAGREAAGDRRHRRLTPPGRAGEAAQAVDGGQRRRGDQGLDELAPIHDRGVNGPIRCALVSASSASCIARNVCFCVIDVSVRLSTSSISLPAKGSATSLQST